MVCTLKASSEVTWQGTMRLVDWSTVKCAVDSYKADVSIEQMPVWAQFDEAMPDRSHWGCLLYTNAIGEARAVMSLTAFKVRGFSYLWAKQGPVWLGKPPSASEEKDLRQVLVAGMKIHAPNVVFVRLHATYPDNDLHELLQTMTYDRTVVLDLDRDDEAAILSSFKSRGRRDVRKALRNEQLTFHDETERFAQVFDELYEVLTETGERDGFRAAAKSTYLTMLQALAPKHARLYVARLEGGQALAWSLVTIWKNRALRYYAGSSALGRRLRAADALVYKEACWLQQAGVHFYDLMGVDSPRAPELVGVREFKNKFVTTGPISVPGAWDVPVHPHVYAALVRAMKAKHRTESLVAQCANSPVITKLVHTKN